MLDFDEFRKAVSDFGLIEVDPQDVEGLFKSMDSNQNGTIDFNEFLRALVGDMN